MLIVKAAPSKPQIVELEGHAVNGTNYRLNCSTQSNSQPPNHNMSMFSAWRRDDMLIYSSGRYIVKGTELIITNITNKEDSGSTLTCVTFEDQFLKSMNSDAFIMDVKYGPENSVHLASIPPTLGFNLHQTAPVITCSATCNPPCDYRWYQNGTFFRNGATLSLGIVEKTTRGNYRCEAYTNILGVNRSSSTSVNIIVYFGAEIVNMSINESNTVNENSSAIFQCLVESSPPSNITWMKESNGTILKTESGVVQSQYRIESAQCLNMDNYTCSAYNEIWTPAKATLPLFVRCHPRTDYRISHDTKVYRRRYEAVVLRYTVISYPLPTFRWIFLGNGSVDRGLPVSAIQYSNGLQSELRFSSLEIDDFGNYSVIADNSLPPSAREIFEIIPAGKRMIPEYPNKIHCCV
ncbi:hypothetical protein ACJMK2_022628 [Sinanodonta woodiana]|uniref:Ig-like domain-containing protein n=1 Tax=Sinanodonta woodiana TaxID=1069815 RepID=A0ABD3TJU4_SINWO